MYRLIIRAALFRPPSQDVACVLLLLPSSSMITSQLTARGESLNKGRRQTGSCKDKVLVGNFISIHPFSLPTSSSIPIREGLLEGHRGATAAVTVVISCPMTEKLAVQILLHPSSPLCLWAKHLLQT